MSATRTRPSFLDFLCNPKAAVDHPDSPQLVVATMVVLSCAAANVVGAVASVQWLAPALPGNTASVYVLSTVIAVLLPVTVWIGSAVAFYVIATLSFIDVDLRATIWMVGVGMVPYLVGSLLGTAATLFAITQVPAPESVRLLQSRMSHLQSLSVVRYANFAHFVAVAWTGGNWIVMGATVWDVSVKRAVKIVAGPLALLLFVFARIKLL